MKKVKLLLGIFCLALVSSCCSNSNKEGEGCKTTCQKEEKKCCCVSKCEVSEEQKAFAEKWQNFENLAEEEQKEIIGKAKSCFEKNIAERKACIEKCEATLVNFDSLTVAEQKALLDGKVACTGKSNCCKDSKCCAGKKKCTTEKKECSTEKKEEDTKEK